jgi:hypothetical protein
MSKTTTKLPKFLLSVIKKYSIASAENVIDIFDAYFEENTIESERFERLIKRLVKRKTIKQKFYDLLDAQGRFDLGDDDDDEAEVDTDEAEDTNDIDEDLDDTDEDDSDEDSAEDEDDTDEDDDSVEDDDDSDEATDEDDDDDTSEDSDDDDDDDTAEDEDEVGYDATGIPTLEEVTNLISTEDETFKHREEFENPTHLLITARALEALEFTGVSYDSRVKGGTIKRPRGGRFVLDVEVLNKRAVKRRGKTAPVFAFTNQLVESFDAQAAAVIDGLIDSLTSEEDDED